MDNRSLFDPEGLAPGIPSGTVEIFTFPETGQQIRIIGTAENPLFCHVDVCRGLDHSNPSVALGLVEDDDRVQVDVRETDIPNLNKDKIINPMMWFLTEAGFYDLALASKAPRAKLFKRWITHDVLPALRKSGSYSVVPQPRRELTNRELAMMVIEEADRADRAEARVVVADRKIRELAPKAEQAEHHRAADGLKAVGDFANDIKAWAIRTHGVKVKHKQVWDFLAHLKLLIRGNTVRHNQPTAFATEHDFVRVKRSTFERSSGFEETSASPRLTPAGEGYAWDRITRYIAEHGSLDVG